MSGLPVEVLPECQVVVDHVVEIPDVVQLRPELAQRSELLRANKAQGAPMPKDYSSISRTRSRLSGCSGGGEAVVQPGADPPRPRSCGSVQARQTSTAFPSRRAPIAVTMGR
jgi:hypothetical protein